LDYDSLQVNFKGQITGSEWSGGDEIGVFGQCSRNGVVDTPLAVNSRYIINSAGSDAQLFKASDDDGITCYASDHAYSFQAYYPYRSGLDNPTALDVEVPTVQEYAKGVKAYSTYVASYETTTVIPTIDMAFKSLNSVIELYIPNDFDDISNVLRRLELSVPDGAVFDGALAEQGVYNLSTDQYTVKSGTESNKITLDFGSEGLTLTSAYTKVALVVRPFVVPEGGLSVTIVDVNNKSLDLAIFTGESDAGKEIEAGSTTTKYLSLSGSSTIPVTFPVEWPVGYANNAYIVSKETQPQWLTDSTWICPSQTQAYIRWHKASDPSTNYTQKLEYVNSSSKIGSIGIKGVWTDDYFEFNLPVKKFAAGTTLTFTAPFYTRQGPVFWYVEYLDGNEWKCNTEKITAYDANYSMNCTFSLVRGTQLVTHRMTFSNDVSDGVIKIRVRCADGSVQASADATCTTRTIPYTGSTGYDAPFYFYDAQGRMTSVKIAMD
jgi:hypothetical protein